MDGQTPSPGSPAAIAQSCRCAVSDNHHGQGVPSPGGPRFWVRDDCPLHGTGARLAAPKEAHHHG